MPTKQFLHLGIEKQNSIIQASVREFSQNGFINASTNKIVKDCEISKGSLFKYFTNKEDLYFYTLDQVSGEMLQEMESGLKTLSTDLFQRIIDYSALEISWYIENPMKGHLVIRVAAESDMRIRSKIIERYGRRGENLYYELLKGIEGVPESDIQQIADILKWVLKGFNDDFLEKVNLEQESMEQLKKEYIQKLTEYIEILKKGFSGK